MASSVPRDMCVFSDTELDRCTKSSLSTVMFSIHRKDARISDVPLLSGISGLSFNSPFLYFLFFFFLPSSLAVSVL